MRVRSIFTSFIASTIYILQLHREYDLYLQLHREYAPSLYLLLDGICSATVGVRFERDIGAAPLRSSVCPFRGPPPAYIPLAAYDGLYRCSSRAIPAVVAAVASHHDAGVSGPLVGWIHGVKSARARVPVPWFQYLRPHSVLRVDLPVDALGPDGPPVEGLMFCSPCSSRSIG